MREQRNSRSRTCYQKKKGELTVDDREGMNEKIRDKHVQRRKSMSVIEKGQSSALRKASYAKRKNTPCKESLALPRPNLANSTSECPASSCRAIPLGWGAEDDSSDGDNPPVVPNYGVVTNGMKNDFVWFLC